MIEKWKSVVGFEELYEVSDLGRVRSMYRVVQDRNSSRTRILKGKLLKPGRVHKKYLKVRLYAENYGTTLCIHKLVLEAFTGLKPKRMEARHLNNIPADNRWENLVWDTHIINEKDKIGNGTLLFGERHYATKLSKEKVIFIRTSSKKQKELAALFGVSQQIISKIRCGGCWNHD